MNELVAADYTVRGTVRPGSDASAIVRAGATPVEVDLRDERSTRDAVDGVDAVFVALLGRGENAAATEREITRNVIDAARADPHRRIVYTSVHGATDRTGVPHFEVKGEIERYLEGTGLPYTILRPTTFTSALSAPWLREGVEDDGVLATPIRRDTPITYLDTADLASIGRLALETDRLRDVTLPVGGPEPVTYRELLPLFAKLTGREITYRPIPIDRIESTMGADVAAMIAFFNERGFVAESDSLLDQLDVERTTVEEYLRSAWSTDAARASAGVGR